MDRFIPARVYKENLALQLNTQGSHTQNKIYKEMFFDKDSHSKILAFQKKPPVNVSKNLRVLFTHKHFQFHVKNKTQNIASNPIRILDAPDISNDYYLNILDWSSKNVLAIGLGEKVYLFNPQSGRVKMLLSSRNKVVTSLKFVHNGSTLAIGIHNRYARTLYPLVIRTFSYPSLVFFLFSIDMYA